MLSGGGLVAFLPQPEVDPLNFAPRVRIPTLMINGRQDFTYPLKTASEPLFRMLGTPPDQKRHWLFDGGHIPPRWQDLIKESLDWYDRYLGPVKLVR